MTFAQPYFLLLLALLPLLAWLEGRRGADPAFRYSSVQLVKGITQVRRSQTRRWLAGLRWGVLVLIILALARPQRSEGDDRVTASGIDIVVALDLSGSMAAEDFELGGERVNRVAIAKFVLEQFIAKRPSDRIGLVAFAGRAYVAAPLTLDHGFLLEDLRRLNLGVIEDSTAIGSALATALNRLRDLPAKSKIIILMTDGQNNAGKIPPLTAAEAAQTLGVKVYAIGVGTRGKAHFPQVDPFGRKYYVPIDVNLDETTLQGIANKTGGKYYRADSANTLRSIYGEIDRLEKTEATLKKTRRYREVMGGFVGAALAMLLLEILLAQTIWRRLP